MKKYIWILGVLAAIVALEPQERVLGQAPAPASASAKGPATEASGNDPHKALVTTYCVSCHNARLKTGGLALDGLNLQAVEGDAPVWEKALRKMRGRQMPPPGSPQPSQKDIDTFVVWMEGKLDANTKGPKAGYVPIQRLNRTEYAAAVKALVGVELKASEVLPQDIQVDGFDNIAAALSVSPSFLDQYVTAARQVARLAVGNPNPRAISVKYSVQANRNPENPPPPGTRDGIRFKHNFPADGEYRLTLSNLGVVPYSASLESENPVVVTLDGKVVFRKSIGGAADLAAADRLAGTGRSAIMDRFSKIPIMATAGVHEVMIAFIDRSHTETGELLEKLQGYAGLTGGAAAVDRLSHLVDGVELAGPYNPTGVSHTASRDLIFVCDPAKGSETTCARLIASSLARRAFRRPVTDEDLNRLMPFYEAGRKEGEAFDQAIERLVAAVLVSPQFLYRSIQGPKGSSPTKEFPLTDLEFATRLSFFLWNTGPDDELLQAANKGLLTKQLQLNGRIPLINLNLDAQVRRMLSDPRASSLVSSFAFKWLNLTNLDQVIPDPVLFPEFSEPLRHDFLTEVDSFVGSIFSEDRSVMDLLNADYTFVNERLAKHYGIPGVVGPQFRKATSIPKEREGLLGKAAILLRTSYGDRTSPVLRGNWVLDKINGTPTAPPPPDTATDLSQKAGEVPKTVRARLEQHRAKASCNMCHGVIDPTGLPLENYDAIGRWRTVDSQAAGAAIDARTVLPTGVAINGVVELRQQISANPEKFARTVTERLMMYALNRQLEYFDMPQVRAIVRNAARDNYKLSSLIIGIVNSEAFRKQGVQTPPTQTQPPAAIAAAAKLPAAR